jgi:hypothetical protein
VQLRCDRAGEQTLHAADLAGTRQKHQQVAGILAQRAVDRGGNLAVEVIRAVAFGVTGFYRE